MLVFFGAVQAAETEAVFAIKVKELADRAGITDAVLLNNKVITGLKNPNVKFEMLKKRYNTFEEMYKDLTFLTGMKKLAGLLNTTDIVNEVAETSVNKMKFDNKKKKEDKEDDRPKNKDNKKLTCYFCNRPGHIQRNCFKYKAARSANEVKEQPQQQQQHQQQQQNEGLANRLGQLRTQ